MDLTGRAAVVTGGGSGFGAAMARVLAEAGAAVALLDIDGAAADLTDDHPYLITHGGFRPWYRQRRDAMDAAFDRMERS